MSTPSGDHLPLELQGQAVVLRAWATWCGSCRALAPVVDQEASTVDVAVHHLDIETDPDLVDRLGIRSVPTLIGFRDGEEVGRLVGLQPAEAVRSLFVATSAGIGPVTGGTPRSLIAFRGAAGLALVAAGLGLGSVPLMVVGVALVVWAAAGLLRSS